METVGIRKVKRPVGSGRWRAYALGADVHGRWCYTPPGSLYLGWEGLHTVAWEVGRGNRDSSPPVIQLIPQGDGGLRAGTAAMTMRRGAVTRGRGLPSMSARRRSLSMASGPTSILNSTLFGTRRVLSGSMTRTSLQRHVSPDSFLPMSGWQRGTRPTKSHASYKRRRTVRKRWMGQAPSSTQRRAATTDGPCSKQRLSRDTELDAARATARVRRGPFKPCIPEIQAGTSPATRPDPRVV